MDGKGVKRETLVKMYKLLEHMPILEREGLSVAAALWPQGPFQFPCTKGWKGTALLRRWATQIALGISFTCPSDTEQPLGNG